MGRMDSGQADDVAHNGAEAAIRILCDRNKDIRRIIDEMHPVDRRDLEDRIERAIWNEFPASVKED